MHINNTIYIYFKYTCLIFWKRKLKLRNGFLFVLGSSENIHELLSSCTEPLGHGQKWYFGAK